MAAFTSVVAAVGLGVSTYQMIHQNKLRKDAEAAQAAAVAKARGIREQNKLLALQAPTEGIELAQEQQARREATIIPTLQKDARTALGGTTRITQIGAEEDLALAAEMEKKMYDRDLKVLGEEADIEKRRVDREAGLAAMEIEGAGMAARDAAEAQARATESAIALGGELGSEYQEPWEKKERRSPEDRKARRRGERGRRQYERHLRRNQ